VQEVTKYPHGTFSWIDLATTDTAAAKAFYAGLFGWSYADSPVSDGVYYTMFDLHGKSVAGMSALQPDQQQQGIPPHWNSYVTVENVEESAQKAQEAGGTLLAPPFDVMDAGRMAVIQDPTGAVFSMWEPRDHIGASLVNIPGTLVWNELATRDTDQASAFYNTLFGWTTSTEDNGSGIPYTMFSNRGRAAGGMLPMTEEWGEMPPHWMVYFAVDDCDASLEKAKELGGTVHVGPIDIPNTGRFALMGDPQGAVFTIIQMLRVDPPPQG